jgi:hypothetical protein
VTIKPKYGVPVILECLWLLSCYWKVCDYCNYYW